MGKRKYTHSFEIALSAISCAVAVVCLLVGFWSDILLASGYLFAMVALMVPLSKRFYVGGFLAYMGTVILAIIMGAAARFWDLVPFIMFFGLHPLINCLQVRFKINKWLALAVKAAWFDFTLWVAYILIFGGILGGDLSDNAVYEFINNYIYYFIFIGGTVLFFPYDYVVYKMQNAVDKLVYRIRK